MESNNPKPSWDDIRQTKEIKIRYIVLAVIVAVVVRFWGESSISLLQEDVPVITDTEISQEEVYHFIKTQQECIDENIIIDEDFTTDNVSEKGLDTETHEWFLVRGWRPKRFLYVKRRIRNILEHIYAREKKLAEADQFEKLAQQYQIVNNIQEITPEAENSTASELIKKAHDIRYYADREIRYAGITALEDETVSDNIAIIEALLERN